MQYSTPEGAEYIAVCLPALIWLVRREYGLRVATVLSSGVALFGAYWFVGRLMGA